MNKCMLIGRLTKDPDLRATPNGVSVCTFTLAIDRRFKNQNGERESDFIPVVAWRQQAEFAAKYFRKGSMVAVAGTIQTRTYEVDAGKRYITEVIADEVQPLTWPEGTGDTQAAPQTGARTTKPAQVPMQEIDEELPF